ncbi:prepilin-type N-terminal cleavage/methylation domain-containing protein [Streptomyces sp. NPDC089922]|uniref:prepilin-type N-terminal cleavage/methylation domain-containing protein n=1 Tax=Streptomyces sp. NPDC089922 TaxID=3155189 RepID=UPI00342FBA18
MTPDHRPFPWRPGRQDGFTLIELLVVIVILGVLSAIVVFSVRGIGDKGRKNAIAADAATLRTAQESYCAKHGRFGTVDDLKTDGLLAGEPVYNTVVVGEGNECGKGENSSFTLYDTSTPTQSGADAIPVGSKPSDVAVDAKADRVYVVSTGGNSVTAIDGRTDTPIGSPIDVSGAVTAPTQIAVDPDRGRVYVGGTGGVAVIDTADGNRVTAVGGYATTVSGLAVSPENGDVYVGGGTSVNSVVAYIPAGTTSATAIPLPGPSLVSGGMDFHFDPERHAVYFAKSGNGSANSPAANVNTGLYAISTQTHQARVVVEFPTRSGCGTNAGNNLVINSVRGTTVVDPRRNLVYLLARRCVPDPADPTGPWKSVATTIAVNPGDGTSTSIDEPVGTLAGALTAVYNPVAGAVYVYFGGGSQCNGQGGRIDRVVGTAATGRALVCGMSSPLGNPARRIATLDNFNRVFVAQRNVLGAPGGLGVADGGTLLTSTPLGTPQAFVAMAVNNRTAKVYAVDQANGTVAVFTTGSD